MLSACARVLRPIVRLALSRGVKHAHLDEVLRRLLIDEARRMWQGRGVEPNISQLSITTGLHRKAVTSMVRDEIEQLPSSEASAPARTVTRWLHICTDDPSCRKLPISADAQTPSFESVAHEASHGNVHHRAVLDELLRLGMVRESDGFVELKAEGFVPAQDMRSMLAFLGDNTRDHLMAAVSNTLGEQAAFLERSVFAKGIAAEDCERIHGLVRARWSALHHELSGELTKAFTEAPTSASSRMRVGIYAYYEDGASQANPEAPDPPRGRRP
ncbi:DUF6502 family protein [Variovorax sp. YR216]|uniref:DUF6502 family protein n=1 Tax=Variovorax sp. YR216 TaxID=1882828 RepID=UPI00210B3E69|nr:DUF6502 family protein [Variovorax sp. YR216]